MRRSRILVIEDDEDIRELINYNLRRANFDVEGVASGSTALKAVESTPPDLILLDLMLPGIEGMDLCRSLKDDARYCEIPIIMVTAKGEERDVVKGLETGADDYITKPFSPRVLIARVQAQLRRQGANGKNGEEVLRFRNLSIHPGRFEVLVNGEALSFTHSEFRILHLLAKRPGWVFSRYQIVDQIRGRDYAVTDRAVDVTIVSIRRKLGALAGYIETVRGVGYKFSEQR